MIPLTSHLVDDAAPLRFRIARRDQLKDDSDAMIDPVRTIDNRRLAGEPLARLAPGELAEVEEYLKIVLGMPAG